MSSWAIYKKQSLEKRYCLFYFVLGFVCFTSAEKFLYRVFARNIPRIVRDHVKVYISFLSLGIQSQKIKFMVHITHNEIYFSREW